MQFNPNQQEAPVSAAQRNQISPDQARAAVTCTKCGSFHGGGYVVEKNSFVSEYVGASSANSNRNYETVARRQVVAVDAAENPTYSHCRSCADAYLKRQQRRDVRKAKNARVRATGENQTTCDCTLVAISKATGLAYSKVATLAKRLAGYNVNQQRRGMNVFSMDKVLKAAAQERGKVAEFATAGPSTRHLAATFPKNVALVTAATQGATKAHAMSVVKGQLYNAHGSWGQATTYMAWVVRKES